MRQHIEPDGKYHLRVTTHATIRGGRRADIRHSDDDESATLLSDDERTMMEMQGRVSIDDDTFIDQIRTSAATDVSHLADHSQGALSLGLRMLAWFDCNRYYIADC